MSSRNLLAIDELRKEYGDLIAVDNVSFDVNDGEFVTILGPSGSGKSTILRMIAGFENPTSGEINIWGEDIVGSPPFQRDVNMVFQHLALFPHFSVEENITYGLKNKGVAEEERKERVDEMLEMVHLEGYNDRDPEELSGGEQQRVALARALVNEPEVVLFDEPLASLDRQLRQHMQKELQRIQKETGVTFVYVTHDQEIALSVADRLVLLNEGQIEQIGSAKEIYEDPESWFVAEFMGDMNTIQTTVDSSSSNNLLQASGMEFELASSRTEVTSGNGDGKVAMCIRPHDLTINEISSGSSEEVKGSIQSRIYQGNTLQYEIDTPVGLLTVTTSDASFDIGDEVFVKWDLSDVHLFAQNAKTTEDPINV
jgi:spermidine/putrescine transport system ATP-binding protein